MTSAIVYSDAGRHGPDLRSDLSAFGYTVTTADTCPEIARLLLLNDADVVVCYHTKPDDAFFSAMSTLNSLSPRPLVVFTPDATSDDTRRAVDTGIHAFVVAGYSPRRIRPTIALATARFHRDQLFRSKVTELDQRLSEAPLVDRATAILMGARQLREDEAFQTLHLAAIESRQRIGRVARSVIETALYAEAVNRAGQLRMLSQRLVKLYALAVAGILPEDTHRLIAQSVQQAEDGLTCLRRKLPRETFDTALDGVELPWRVLADGVREPAEPGRLAELDTLADEVLGRADRLVECLEVEHLARTLRLVNLCGRQRMLSQRLAKEALLAVVLERPGMVAERAESDFVAALDKLCGLEFTSPVISAELAAAAEVWTRFQDALQYARHPAGQAAIATLSEDLLERFEKLTGLYETGIQTLIG